jgi:NAD(P)H-dependent FMN reductase
LVAAGRDSSGMTVAWKPGQAYFPRYACAKDDEMIKVAIIIGSTRPGRVGEAVGKWVSALANQRDDAQFELVDIKDFDLPLLDEPVPPSQQKYSKDHTKRWAAKIASFDAFVFVTPEYNHGISGALKNAIDFLYAEWNNKAAGFVGYGSAGGARAVEHLRLVMAEVQVATVRNQVALSLFTDFENFTVFKPASYHEKSLSGVFDQVIAWGGALKELREKNKHTTA